MAQVKLAWPIVGLSGSIDEQSPYTFRYCHQTGRTFIVRKPYTTPEASSGNDNNAQ